MSNPLMQLTMLPDKQPFTIDYTSILAVSRYKKQGQTRYTTLVYIGSLTEFIEVSESHSEVVALWRETIEANAETDVELKDDEEIDETNTGEDNHVEKS